uniref:Uncharacterized protein n=1 Tax=Arundo donax TaxID=35708 RepID=A0A0A8Y815_ARUDO
MLKRTHRNNNVLQYNLFYKYLKDHILHRNGT